MTTKPHHIAPLALAVATAAFAPTLAAVDGVIEINQARASAGGVTPGDTPGFPVTISLAGSYRLTGNLTVPNENTTAIQVTADNVSIDLNGFSIVGPVTCTGSPVRSCSNTGSGVGILVSGDAAYGRLTVMNGSVSGMGFNGVQMNAGRVDQVRFLGNGGSGLLAISPVVSRCEALGNRSTGIQIEGSALISGSTSSSNGVHGIVVGRDSLISGSTSSSNGSDGIDGSFGTTMTGNNASQNGNHGMTCSGGCTLVGNTVYGNIAFGLYLGQSAVSRDGYASNVITGNSGGTVAGGIAMGSNVCNGTATCP